jgi:hypothetical protein
VLYWIGFVIVLGYVIKQGFGDRIAGMVKDQISGIILLKKNHFISNKFNISTY